MGIKEREWKHSTFNYIFAFNGQERDDEVAGDGNSLNFEARIYDSRLWRWMSVDPLTKSFAYYTPYQFAANMPIAAVDLDALKGVLSTGKPVSH